MRAAIVTAGAEVVEEVRRATPHVPHAYTAIADLVADVLAGGTVEYAVVGVPGVVDYEAGEVVYAPNIPPEWIPHLGEAALADALGISVHLANDADLAAVGEAYFGAGAAFTDVVYMTVSTGVGAGVVYAGRLVHGRRSGAEIGHTIVDVAAASECRPCTVEDLASGTALGRIAEQAGLGITDGRGIQDRVRAGDGAYKAVWDGVATVIGVAAANLVRMYTPDVVVVGGGVGLNVDLTLGPIRDALDRFAPPAIQGRVAVAGAALGDAAGIVGAAAWQKALRP
jgi:glucokinase